MAKLHCILHYWLAYLQLAKLSECTQFDRKYAYFSR
jgi:hypothetical protein